MNAKRVNTAAGVIDAAMKNGKQTPTGIAFDLESAQLLMSPEVAAEVDGLRVRVAELEARLGDGRPADEDPITYTLTAEASCGRALSTGEPCPDHPPRTERSHWVAIAAALNAAHAAGMPVGIDLDGTLTDRNAWSVVWDRGTEQWTVAGYDDAEADGITRRIAPTQALREDTPAALRAEDAADILTLAPAQHAAATYNETFRTIELELTATQRQWSEWLHALDVDISRTTHRGGCVTSHATWRGVQVVIRCWWARPKTVGELVEDPHDGPLHHDYRVSRDLPETGGEDR